MNVKQAADNKLGLFSRLVVGLIVFYQKMLSPLKGFSCAHRFQHGGLSCSEYAKQVVLAHGAIPGIPVIRSRFRDCRSAALKIQRRQPHNEAGFLDCSPDACVPDGCGGPDSIASCFDGGGPEGDGKSTSIIFIPLSLVIFLLLVYAGASWIKGPQVTSIQIRLIAEQQEVKEKGVARLIGGDNPDYQVVFMVNGRKIVTDTRANSTAKNWLSLRPTQAFSIKNLTQMTILNKQVLKDETLEVIDDPQLEGRGETYEYRMTED